MTDPQPLTPTTPADTALRHLSRHAKEQALSAEPAEGQPDMRPVWRFLGMFCGQLNRLTRQLPEGVRSLFVAEHLSTMLSMGLNSTPADSQERQAWRMGYAVLLATLQGHGLMPQHRVGDVVVACSLWACLQRMALEAAMSDLRPRVLVPGQNAQQEVQALRQQLMELREMLITDWAEAMMAMGGALMAQQQRAAQVPSPVAQESIDAMNQAKAEIVAHEVPAQESPAP